MSGKRLTRKEVEEYERAVGDVSISRTYLRGAVSLLVDHVKDVGVFAPEEPTDEQIADAIAMAQSWEWRKADAMIPGTYPAHWRKPNGESVITKDYQPATNLGQALEAAAALRETLNDSLIGKWAEGFAEDVWKGLTPAEDAARGLSRRLYDRIREEAAK